MRAEEVKEMGDKELSTEAWERQVILEVWKQTVAVQMHFNDIAMRIRSFALTVIAAILTASGLAQGHGNAWVLSVPVLIWPAFYLMDRYWYHPLLMGAVYHGGAIERRAKELGLILPAEDARESGHSLLGLAIRIGEESGKTLKLHAHQKMFGFYLIFWLALWIIWIVSLVQYFRH
jgi:hypothetical protein